MPEEEDFFGRNAVNVIKLTGLTEIQSSAMTLLAEGFGTVIGRYTLLQMVGCCGAHSAPPGQAGATDKRKPRC